jgi:hypothetical protein
MSFVSKAATPRLDARAIGSSVDGSGGTVSRLRMILTPSMTRSGRRRPDVTPEVSREVGLIVEPDARCHLRDGLPVEEAASRGLDPPRHDMLVRGIWRVRAFRKHMWGLHAGPVVFQGGDYFGCTVNIAARIAEYARLGELLVTQEVVEASKLRGVVFTSIGPIELKAITESVRLHAARRRDRPSPA